MNFYFRAGSRRKRIAAIAVIVSMLFTVVFGTWLTHGAAVAQAAAGSIVLAPTADALVRGGANNNTNYGNNWNLEVVTGPWAASTRKSYLKFDLADVETVETAALRIYGKMDSTAIPSVTVEVYGVDNDNWLETELTWNNAPTHSGPALDSAVIVNEAGYYEFDVTEFVQEQLAGDRVVSLVLINATETDKYTFFHSKENQNKPSLVIEGGTAEEPGGPDDPDPNDPDPNEPEAPTTYLIDNTDPGFTSSGGWVASGTQSGFYGADYLHDGTPGADDENKWALWTPDIQRAGEYEIYMRWVAFANRPVAAPLEIAYDGGIDTSRTINQRVNGSSWVLIGTYRLAEGTGSYVKLFATDEGHTIADAIRFDYVVPKPPEVPTTDVVEVETFGPDNAGSFRVIEYEATPSIDGIDTAIGVAGSAFVPEARAEFPIAVRLNAEGTIDAVNGAGHGAENTVAYTAGTSYYVKLVVNLAADTYDAWVTPPGGAAVQIAVDYAFAAEAPPLDNIGGLYKQTNEEGLVAVEKARLIDHTFLGHGAFAEGTHRLASDNNGNQVLRFDVLPITSASNEIMGVAGHETAIFGFGDLPMIVRMSGGVFDAYDRIGYNSEGELRAVIGTRYHVKLAPDFGTGTYSVWVAPEGGEPVQIADAYAFRSTSSAGVDNIGQFMAKTDSAGKYEISNLVVLDEAGLAAAIDAVNSATTAEQMRRALTSSALGLSLDKFHTMTEEERNKLAADLLEGVPYESDLFIQRAFDNPILVREDMMPPTAPTDLAAEAADSLQVKLTWTEATDDVGIHHYTVLRDGAEIADVAAGTVYADSGLQPSTTYSYTVKAYDHAGKEAESEPVTVTTVAAEEAVAFPLTHAAVDIVSRQLPLAYALIPSSKDNPLTNEKYMTMMEYDPNRLKSAFAFYYLTIASMYNPNYMASDGTTVSERALAHIGSVIGGGNEPAMSGNGLNATGYLPVLNALAVARHHVPAIWEQLTESERGKLDLMMEAALIGAHWGYSDKNNFNTGLDQTGNFGKEWNPNYRNGGIGSAIATVHYFGADTANGLLKNFNYDDFMAELNAAGLTNIAVTFASTGKSKLEQATRNDGPEGFTYKGHTLHELGLWLKELTDYNFSEIVTPHGGERVPVSPTYPYGYQGFMVGGYDEFPNLGALGMALEFNASDGGGGRSSLSYAYAGWQSAIQILYTVGFLGDEASGLSASELTDIVTRMGVGTADMFYKDAQGYNDYQNALNRGTYKISGSYGEAYTATKELWLRVIDNPQEAVAAVNAAASLAELKETLESGELALVLYGYNALSEAGQGAVVEALAEDRPAGGYASKADIQTALYNAVRTEALRAVNGAQTADELADALQSAALGLYKPSYDSLAAEQREAAAELLLERKPAGGYAGKAALRTAVGLAVDTVNGGPERLQLKNLPPVAPGNQRIDIADYEEWPELHGDAGVALWNDDKAGAFSITIDDNYVDEHDQWLALGEQYGFDFTWFAITGYTSGALRFNADAFTRLIEAGQDVQSHTVNHRDMRNTANFTEADYTNEYLGAIQAINALPGGNAKTLGYPHGNGNQDIAAQHYIAARGVQGLPNQAGTVNYMQVSSFSSGPSVKLESTGSGDTSVESIVKTLYDPNVLASNVSYYRGWTNAHYHSLKESGANPSTGTTVQVSHIAERMLEYLDDAREHVWMGTFTDIAMYAQQRDTHKLTVTDRSAERIAFTLTDDMDDELFDYPLTVKVRVDNGWSGIAATQNGSELPVAELMNNGNKYALVKAVPDRGEVELIPQPGSGPGGGDEDEDEDDNGTGNGGDDDGDNGGDNGPGNGNNDDEENGEQSETSVTIRDGAAVAELSDGRTNASIPLAQVGELPLIVQSNETQVTITPALLADLLERSGGAADAVVTVRLEPLAADALGDRPAGGGAALVRNAGGIVDIRVSLVTEDGREYAVEQTGGGITVVLPYDEAADEALLGIYYYNEQTKEWEYVGGRVDAVNGVVSVQLEHLSIYGVLEYDKAFDDVPSAHWAARTLQILAARHLITGVTDSEFQPDRPTTRAEFTAMLVRALGLQATEMPTTFADVASGAWYADEVAAAYEAGLVTGVASDRFAPEALITREQLAALLVRAYEYKAERIASDEALSQFRDGTAVSGWAREAVNKALTAALMQGKGEALFAPLAAASRAETAQAIMNLLESIE